MSTGKEQLEVDDDLVESDDDGAETPVVEVAKTNLSKRRLSTISWKSDACKNSWPTTISTSDRADDGRKPPLRRLFSADLP